MTGTVNGPPSMSADGRWIAWLSSGDSAPHLVVYDVPQRSTRARGYGAPVGVRAFTWAHWPGTGLAVTDATGGENWAVHLFRDGGWSTLAESPGAQLRIAGLSARRPDEVLVATNARDAEHADYDVLSLRTGARVRVLENPGCAAVYFDADFRPRLLETVREDGSRDLWHGDPARRRLYLHIPHEAALSTRVCHFAADGATVYVVMPDGPDRTRLVALRCVDDEPSAELETVFTVRRADVLRILPSPTSGRPEYLEIERFRRRMVALTPARQQPLRALSLRLGAQPAILQRDDADRHWLVAHLSAEFDARYLVYRPDRDELWPVSCARPGRQVPVMRCRPVDVPMRTGDRAVTYLTATGETTRPKPAVLLVHGGPWRRTGWAFEQRRAWLAEQGFTVLEPNFRGSTGFGAGWVNAADRQWGAAMQDDLEDTLDWSIRRGHADPERIALFGGSYGGYAVLQLAATSARRFRCVVATSPLTDLVEFVTKMPAPWGSAAPMVRRRIGDPLVPAQRRELEQRSPLHHAGTMHCPVLLIHGANDARVPVDMSTRMFMALARAGQDATLALLPGEGHEIVGTDSQRARDDLVADFLGRHVTGVRRPDEPTTSAGPATTMRILRTPRGEAAVRAERQTVQC